MNITVGAIYSNLNNSAQVEIMEIDTVNEEVTARSLRDGLVVIFPFESFISKWHFVGDKNE